MHIGRTGRSRVFTFCFYSNLNNILEKHCYLLPYNNPLFQFIFFDFTVGDFLLLLVLDLFCFFKNFKKDIFLVIILVGATLAVEGY